MRNSEPCGLLDPLPCVRLWLFKPSTEIGPCSCSLALMMTTAIPYAGQHLLTATLLVPTVVSVCGCLLHCTLQPTCD